MLDKLKLPIRTEQGKVMSKKRMFIIFCLIGVINTLVDLSIYLVLRRRGLAVIPANIISTSVALIVSYVLNKRFTFKSSGSNKQSFIAFVIVTLSGLWLLQPAIIYSVAAILNMPAVHAAVAPIYGNYDTIRNLFGKLAATPATLVWNFLLYKKFVFKQIETTIK